MKRKWMWAALVAGLSLWPLGAQAAGEYMMLAGSINRPAIDDTITAQNALTAAQQAAPAFIKFTACSTVVFNVARFTTVTLWLRVIPSATVADTATVATVAIMPKCVIWDGNAVSADTLAARDSLSAPPSMPEVSAGFGSSQPPAGSGPGAWPGEIVKTIDPWVGRSAVANVTPKSNRFFGTSATMVDLSAEAGRIRQTCGLMQVRIRMLTYSSTVTSKARIQAWITASN